MTYKKIITGGSFGPGHQFTDDRMQFQNCTFKADVKFGKHCDFINCTFVKCCPKANSNISTVGEHARFFDCKLESVQLEPYAELYNTNKSGYLVTIQQPMPIKNKTEKRGGERKIVSDNCCGQRIDSSEVKKDKQVTPCPSNEIQGYSDVPVKSKRGKCPENSK